MARDSGSGVNGLDLDSMAQELHDWMNEEIDALVDLLVDPYPFGARPISQIDQYAAFRQMGQAELTAMIKQLEERYRGFPDARQRVQKALDSYFHEMQKLQAKYGSAFEQQPEAQQPLTP